MIARGHQIFFCMIIFAILSTKSMTGQQYYQVDPKFADSLEGLVDSSLGHRKVDLMNQLANHYAWIYPAKSKALTDEAMRMSLELGYRRGIGLSYLTEGYRMFLHGENGDCLFKALNVFEELDERGLAAKANEYIASNFFFAGNDIQSTLEYACRALSYYEEVNDLDAMAGMYIALSGATANVAFDPHLGESYVEKFLAIDSLVEIPNIFRGVAYAIAGDISSELGDHKEAIRLYIKALAVYDERVIEEKAVKAQQTGALGSYYMLAGMHDSAFFWIDRAIELGRTITYLRGLSTEHDRKANVYLLTGDSLSALSCCDSAIKYGSLMAEYGSLFEREDYRPLIGWSYEIFRPATIRYKKYSGRIKVLSAYKKKIRILESMGRNEELLQCYKAVIPLKDSVFMFLRDQEMREIEVRYETERKDQQISLLSQENELKDIRMRQNRYILLGLSGMLILSVVIGILIIRQSKLKSEQKMAVLEQKLLRSQMNPHFIFNALATIQSLIHSNDNDTASRYLIRFSNLLRHILESTRGDQIDLDDEINNLENYLALQKLRFGERFDYSMKVDEHIDPGNLTIPPMLIQPFVENAIEHGLKYKKGKGHLDIRMERENSFINCNVLDDGIGRAKARALRKNNYRPLAISITRERLDILNRKLKNKVKLEITDLVSENGLAIGTKVRIKIPVSLKA